VLWRSVSYLQTFDVNRKINIVLLGRYILLTWIFLQSRTSNKYVMNRDNHERKLIVLRPWCLLSTSAFTLNQTIERICDGPYYYILLGIFAWIVLSQTGSVMIYPVTKISSILSNINYKYFKYATWIIF
jgi:hypothetical protein